MASVILSLTSLKKRMTLVLGVARLPEYCEQQRNGATVGRSAGRTDAHSRPS
ncbi:hypothetical protein [Enterobacter cloacae]|uniref:hypothetical protein n=1 Tax=Enterobacter cloacae TaxID=550 RepID=UPI0029BFEAE9|nr:hypothetical protein [Enterobacter cloacae]